MADTPDTIPENIEKRIQQFVEIRDLMDALKEKHSRELKPLQELQEQLTGIIRSFMDAHSLANVKTDAGTCYTTTRYTATVQDAEAFMQFVIRTQSWDLIERRANSTAVREYVKQFNNLPNGVNLTGLQQLGVRRPGKKSSA